MAGASDKKIYQWDARTNQVEQVRGLVLLRPSGRTLEGIIRTLSAISHNPLVPSSMPTLECEYPYP